MPTTPERALFLFDNPNFYKNIKDAGLNRGHLNYVKLARNLALKRTVVEVIVFTSPIDRQTDLENYAKQQKFFNAIRASGVTLKLGRLVPRKKKCDFCGESTQIKIEKSVDVQIALEMLIRDDYDVLYLISCDSDLNPAIKHIRSRGKRVFLVKPKDSPCVGVGSVCNVTISITQEHLDAAQVDSI